MFAELHTHSDIGSNTRLIDSTCKVEAIIDKAVELGFAGVAITDHESLSGHIKAIQKYQKIAKTNPDFKLVLGNEIYLIDEADYKNTNEFFHFILLAKDLKGHEQLRKLSTRAWSRVYTHKRVERVPTFYSDLEEIVGKDPGHIIASTACLGSQFDIQMLSGRNNEAKAFVEWCRDLFGAENFFIELQPGISEEQITFNKLAKCFCLENGYNWTITNDVHYLTKDKRELHAAFLSSKDEDRETADFYESTYFKTEREMLDRMDYLGEDFVRKGFENTVKITQMVETYDLHQDVKVPQRPLPKFKIQGVFTNWYDKYEYIEKFAHSEYDQDRYMLSEIEKGFLVKPRRFMKVTEESGSTCLIPLGTYIDPSCKAEEYEIPVETAIARIDTELEQLWKISEKLGQRISSYYNLVQSIVDLMWADDGGNSLVGPSRGSVAGYYTVYLMGIIQIDALQWDLPYWRHLTWQRPELPDVDLDSQSSQRPLIFQKIREWWGENRTLNIITFKKETAKAAMQTACRGLGIDIDISKELSSLIPITRGKVWSIHDCIYGNLEEDRQPVKELKDKINQFPNLLETVLEIENLVSGRSSHASGLYLFNDEFTVQNSMMKTPKGTCVTCWEQYDSDYVGALKIDELTVEALDKIRKCMDLMLDDGLIQWQGTLRATYDKYFNPAVLDYTSTKMWDIVDNGEINDLFQFDTLVGAEAVKKIKPRSLKQVALASSAMRLMDTAGFNPIDRYVSYKNDISLWYEEMKEEGLNQDEIEVLKKQLLSGAGCSLEQETMMTISMDDKISGFDIVLANKLRKGVAKKKPEIVEEVKQKFFKMGKERGTREVMLNYSWRIGIMPQLGYAFSALHTLAYSSMALIEMNMAYHFPIIYWNCACLTVNASANEDVEDNKSTNYGKIAKAIGDMQHHGVKFALPDINTAKFGFAPDQKNNQIIFGLKGINAVGDDIVQQVIQNRFYSSFENFMSKNGVGSIDTKSMINLIKAGCFDSFGDRREIMMDYIVALTKAKVQAKTDGLTLANLPKAQSMNVIPKKFDFEMRLIAFRKYAFNDKFKVDKGLYLLDQSGRTFFDNYLYQVFSEGTEYQYCPDGVVLVKSKFEKWYKNAIQPLKDYLGTDECVDNYNKASYDAFANDVWDKYCTGNISHWEMSSLSFYYHEHELARVNKNYYELSDYEDIPTQPIVTGVETKKSKSGEEITWERYKLYKIVGTVLDKNANKNYITLLTTTGVVTVKFYSGQFTNYDKQLSKKNPDGSKTVIEKSWFQRGNLLLITGIRRNDIFYPKRYFDSVYQHTVCLIEEVSPNGMLRLKYEREKI